MSRWVYILASRRNGTLYIGVTGDLARRVAEHRAGRGGVFTRTHRTTRLVYAERFEDERAARHKRQLEKWPRAWTLRLIDRHNLGWRDLYPRLET